MSALLAVPLENKDCIGDQLLFQFYTEGGYKKKEEIVYQQVFFNAVLLEFRAVGKSSPKGSLGLFGYSSAGMLKAKSARFLASP